MTDQEFAAYREGRYAEQLAYYDRRAISNQWGYRVCAIYVLVMSVMVTPLIALDDLLCGWGIILAKILSPTIAIAAGVNAHFRYHENWLRFRATWDALKRELVLRESGIRDYAGAEDTNALFVDRVESLIIQEGRSWLSTQTQKTRREPNLRGG